MTLDFRRLFVVSYIRVANAQYHPKNAFDAFFPFIVSAADPKAGAAYTPIDIAQRLRDALGWPVTADFVEGFTDDLNRRGLLIRSKAGVYSWTEAAEAPADDENRAEIDHLQRSLNEFAETFGDSPLSAIAPEERIYKLAMDLLGNKLFSSDALEQYAIECDPNAPASTPANFEAQLGYVFARFIQHTKANDDRSFRALLVLTNLGIVTQLVNFFHKRGDSIEKTGSPLIVLDGPFLLDLIGFCGAERRQDAMITVQLARQRRCRIAVFGHSIAEAKDIVTGVVRNFPSHRFGPLAQALRKAEVRTQTLEEFIAAPEPFLRSMKIVDEVISPKDRRIQSGRDLFTQENADSLFGSLMGAWKSEVAAHRDVDSVASIVRMRGDNLSRNPWKSGCFLLSSNGRLARIARDFCRAHDIIGEDSAGPVIARHEFAALLWLAGDTQNKTEIAASQLMTAAQGILARDRALVERVRNYAGGLASDKKEFIDAILQRDVSFEMLQDATFGDPNRFNEKVVSKVVDELIDRGKRQGVADGRSEQADAVRELETTVARVTEQRLNAVEELHAVRDDAADQAQQRAFAEAEAKLARAQATAALQRYSAAVDVIRDLIDCAEAEWNRSNSVTRMVAKWGVVAVGVLLAATLAYLAWAVGTMTGAGMLYFFLAIGVASMLTEWVKEKRMHFEEHFASVLLNFVISGDVAKLNTRLGVKAPVIEISVTTVGVAIANKNAILEALSH